MINNLKQCKTNNEVYSKEVDRIRYYTWIVKKWRLSHYEKCKICLLCSFWAQCHRNCASVKLDWWSYLSKVDEKEMCTQFEYPCFAYHVQFNSSSQNARMNTGMCTHVCRGWASEAAKEQSRAEDQFLRDFFNASGRLLWPNQPTQRPNPSINVQIQNTNTDMVFLVNIEEDTI